MTLTGILVLLLIAGIVGALGQTISGYSFGGCLMSIIVGFVGAFVGVWLARQLGLPEVFTINFEGEAFGAREGWDWGFLINFRLVWWSELVIKTLVDIEFNSSSI